MTPQKQYALEVKEISNKMVRMNMPAATPIVLEFVSGSFGVQFIERRENSFKGLEKETLKQLGFTICKRKESSFIVYAGEKHFYVK